MTKEQLRQYQNIKKEKEQIEDLIAELEAAMTAPKGQNFDGMPFSRSVGESTVEILTVKHLELLTLYKTKVKELDEALIAVETAIEILDPLERSLMRLRYIKGLTWEKVAVALNYSWQQTHRIHKTALGKLREVSE